MPIRRDTGFSRADITFYSPVEKRPDFYCAVQQI